MIEKFTENNIVSLYSRHYGLGVTDADAAAIIAARAKAVVDRVVGECMAQVRTRPRGLREARLVKKFEVRANGL
jgi:hypothetical protein